MRRKGFARLALVAFAATSFMPMPAEALDRCKIYTVGYDRPEWYCEFYADGPITYTVVATSGWRIDRLIKQKNTGELIWVKLAGKDASNGKGVPFDAQYEKVIPAQEGWRIRVQILMSTEYPPLPPPNHVYHYRNGYLEAVS